MGIGGATARRLAEDGASVLIADIEDEAAAANVRTIRQEGVRPKHCKLMLAHARVQGRWSSKR
jgi:NAD(P)-dependent dehydrogenase (short-subunit alcohol dehydrogenase family)